MVVLLHSVIRFFSRSYPDSRQQQTLGLLRFDWQHVVFGACDQHKSTNGVTTVQMQYFLFHLVHHKAFYQQNNQPGLSLGLVKSLFLYDLTHKLSQERCFRGGDCHKSITRVGTVRMRFFLFQSVLYKASYQQTNQPQNIQNDLFGRAHTKQ
jgi:hypothetical protein